MDEVTPGQQATAVSLREAADGLTRRVVAWEKWLNALPGRVATQVVLPSGIVLKFARVKGKTWALIVVMDGADVMLRDAPLALKMEAVGMTVEILNAMAASQQALIAEMEKAIAVFDSVFGDELKKPEPVLVPKGAADAMQCVSGHTWPWTAEEARAAAANAGTAGRVCCPVCRGQLTQKTVTAIVWAVQNAKG